MEGLTFFEAALRVLEEAGGGPLHYREITRRAIAEGLIRTVGLTPEATIGAILYSHVKQMEVKGQPPKVRSLGKGFFALPSKSSGRIENIVEENNREVGKKLLAHLCEMDPSGFEQLIGTLLAQIGFENVEVTGRSGDGGLDVQAELTVGGITRVKTAIQVKRWRNNVPGKIVRELRGALVADQRGLVIATSDFTKEATSEASAAGKVPISLVDGEKLVALLAENQIGVKTRELRYDALDLEQVETLGGYGRPAADDRFLGLWPLPGGTRKYVDSAVIMLRHVAQESPTLVDMIAWVKANFEKAQSEKTIAGYLGVLRTLGLAEFDGENLVSTAEGSQAVGGDARAVIRLQLQSRVAGIREILDALKSGPMTKQEIHALLLNSLGTSWETTAQTDFRLLWLENVGLVEKDGQAYRLSVQAS